MDKVTQNTDINIKEALERLSLPMFFPDDKRMEAYFIVMENGNPVQKVLAEKAVEQYPFGELILAAAEKV
jgi:hypothetical protein